MNEGDRLKLDFALIGAQKSASTLLHRALAQHPDVFMPAEETPVFEDPDYSEGRLRALADRLASAPRGACVGIKRPDYLARPVVAERLALHAGKARLVVTLRNPVDRAVSAYHHYMLVGHLPVQPLEKGLLRLIEGWRDPRWPRAAEVLRFGLYHHHLRAYRQLFPPHMILVLLQEDFTSKQREVLDCVYDFLGVRKDVLTPGTRRAKEGVYSQLRLRYRAAVRPLLQRKEFDGMRRPNRDGRLARALLHLDNDLLARLPSSRPRLSERLRAQLAGYYRDDVLALARDLDRDLSYWLDPPPVPPRPDLRDPGVVR